MLTIVCDKHLALSAALLSRPSDVVMVALITHDIVRSCWLGAFAVGYQHISFACK
jgi:hypothetical protein